MQRLEEANKVDVSKLPHPETDNERVKNPKYLVLIGVCTHLGCVPASEKENIMVGFVPAMDHIMTLQGELGKVPPPLI